MLAARRGYNKCLEKKQSSFRRFGLLVWFLKRLLIARACTLDMCSTKLYVDSVHFSHIDNCAIDADAIKIPPVIIHKRGTDSI